jgi:hypothetical protein
LQYWTENVALRSDPQNHFVPFWNNVSLQALAYRLFTETPAFDHKGTSYSLSILSLPDHWVHAAGICIVLAVIAVPLVYRVRYRTESALVSQWGGIALAFALAPLFTPVAEKHHFVLLVPAYVYIASLWRDSRMKDRVFRGLVFGSFISTTLTAKFFVGNFVNKFLFASGAIAFGAILLAAAIFRAAHCLEAER